MKLSLQSLIIFISVIFSHVHAFYQPEAIYGEDDREELYSYYGTNWYEAARSVVAIMPKTALGWPWLFHKDFIFRYKKKLKHDGICSDERFANQKNPAICTGFLIDKDKILTAAHCIKNYSDCKSYYFVFDFKMNNLDDMKDRYSNQHVFLCDGIIKRTLREDGVDYMLIQLTKEVKGRTPLKLRTEGEVNKGDSLVMIGHPSGLPVKISNNATVTKKPEQYTFTTDLDAFGGNSGSPVFNERTMEVEGLLIRGSRDYIYNSDKGCDVYHRCSKYTCGGEIVSKISNFIQGL